MIEGVDRGRSAWLDSLLARSPVQALYARRRSLDCVCLAYHGIEDAAQFRRQMDYLGQHFRPVSLDDVIAAIRGSALPPRAALITFDDGERSVFESALPILVERGFPAVVFAVPGILGTDCPFWWREVDELLARGGRLAGLPSESAEAVRVLKRMPNSERLECIRRLRTSSRGALSEHPQLAESDLLKLWEAGIAIGNHTMSHPCLDRCTDEEVELEVTQAHEALSRILPEPPRAFAFPNGNHDSRAERVINTLAYEAAFLFDHNIGTLAAEKRFRISRVRVDSTTPMDRFRIILSGLHPAIHHALGRP